MSVGSTQTSETAAASSTAKTAAAGKKLAKEVKVVTYVDIARDLAKLEDRQATQRTELAATDALIADKQKELSTLVSGIGRKK